MNFDAWLDGAKVVAAKHNKDRHTFELTVKRDDSAAPQVVLLNVANYPNHPPFKVLDEEVRIHETVKVILKPENELNLIKWKKTGLQIPEGSPFPIGKEKKKLLGGLYKAYIGVSESMKPYVVVEGYKFSPNEVKCLLKEDVLGVLKPGQVDTSIGSVRISKDGNLLLPASAWAPSYIDELISALRELGLV